MLAGVSSSYYTRLEQGQSRDVYKRQATASWTAHTLLTMVRADLLRHLTERDGMSSEEVRLRLRQFVGNLVGSSDIT